MSSSSGRGVRKTWVWIVRSIVVQRDVAAVDVDEMRTSNVASIHVRGRKFGRWNGRDAHSKRAVRAGSVRSRSVEDDVLRVVFSEEEVHRRTAELGRVLAEKLADKRPLILGVLTGGFMFAADLVRQMRPCPPGTTIKFVKASSYGTGTVSSKQVRLSGIEDSNVVGRNVLVVEDIVDTGWTLTKVREYLLERGAISVTIVVLLDKKERREVPVPVDHIGFVCPDEFVVGFGLDYAEEYRTLPYIGVLKPEVYS